jgi:putative MATE family efflux protein
MTATSARVQGRPAKFLEGNLFRHVAVMSLTSSVGLMVLFMVDFVNIIFISWLKDADLTAAVGYAGAILFFTTSFGIGMSIAASALVARAVGRGDLAQARTKATNAVIWGVVFGTVFVVVVFLNLRQLVGLLGASGRTLDQTVQYLSIVVPTLPLLMVGMIGGAILRSHGDARRAMMATIYGGLANAVLDPIMIFGLGLDLTGAAIATVVARFVIAGTALLPVIRHHGGFDRPSLPSLSSDLRPITMIAVPAILTQLATPVGQAFVTRAVSAYGEAAVAGVAITGRMTPVAFGVIFALSGAIGPIIGQNYGAGRLDRVRMAFIEGLRFTALFTLLVAAILFFLRSPIADLFHAEGITRQIIYLFCGPLALLFFFNGVIFVSNSAFNNLGHPFHSTWTNWGRHTVGTIPLALLGGSLLGAPGVLVGQAAGGVLFGGVAWWLALRVMPKTKIVPSNSMALADANSIARPTGDD